MSRHVLTLSCPETPGTVHAITSVLVENGGDIVEHQQFDDRLSGKLFLRTEFTLPGDADPEVLRSAFLGMQSRWQLSWQLRDASARPRVAIMVSRFGHCLNDLLFRWRSGTLPVDIALVVSNHTTLEPMATAANVPFEHVPVTPETKPAAEARLLELIAEQRIDLVVLARYMQVLSDDLCKRLDGRAINIHHSFLPSFKGAKPYHQAHARGVKHVGATAHYVTPDLDEGPIIEQELSRVDHTHTPEDLVTIGRDAECLALARAVRWHAESRVLLHHNRTVVFRR
ncbi:formyltetrahydrofolate deformylase [Amycolatopsis suaedae]|uniref:Formyltetrahydrofolate deformylase n=1 Tax=Amycolatopsis suaedae TaxID=2510978 RepID=A0A4Q7IZW6_9PSEU|nr:formyltetrahydrofolate deformylase [Amycolatopsis suaedae]RZQ60069.1 formyltetrahydrofolate deformylase [Amycolatopsis suaedae]